MVDDPKEVYNILLRQNYRHLLKSKDSVFTTGILTEEMGNELENKLVNDILAGIELPKHIIDTYEDYGETFVNFVQSMKQAVDSSQNRVEPYNWYFGIEEYKEIFSKTKETTACGPSGLHMSHWKSALENETLMKIHSFFL